METKNEGAALRIIKYLFLLCLCTSAMPSLAQEAMRLLQNNDVQNLEKLLSQTQAKFERGEISETELRNAFRPFYEMDDVAASNLSQWAEASPKSYVAHLAYGIYLKRRGMASRGDRYISETPPQDLRGMVTFHQRAATELNASLALSQQPYLSVFHLMTISTQLGDRQKSLALLQLGNKILPTNALVRNRYALSLTPRWGGSYQALDAFIAKTKGDAVPRSVIRQLEAIELQDKGQTFAEQGMHDAAITHFRKALELSEKVGGTFAMDHLPWARRYACSELRELAACQ